MNYHLEQNGPVNTGDDLEPYGSRRKRGVQEVCQLELLAKVSIEALNRQRRRRC